MKYKEHGVGEGIGCGEIDWDLFIGSQEIDLGFMDEMPDI